MSWYTAAWAAWLGMFAVVEGLALRDKRTPGGTLSAHVWAWLGQGWTWRRWLLLAGLGALTGHLVLGWP